MSRIGGRHLTSWFAFWVTLCLNFLHHLSGSPGVTGNWPIRITAVLAGQFAMFGVLLAAKATWLRDAQQRPRPVATILTFIAAGCTRSVVLWGILTQFVEAPAFVVFGGVITGTFTFSAYLALCSYIVNVFSENRQRLAAAAQAQSDLVAARNQAAQVLHDQRRETVESVQAEVIGAFDQMAAGSQTLDAASLQRFINDTVRPASHRLASSIERWQPSQSTAVDPTLRWSRVFDAVGTSRPFAPALQAALCAAPALATAMALTVPRFVTIMFLAVFTPWALLSAGNRVIERLPRSATARTRIAVVVGWSLLTAAVVAVTWGGVLVGTSLARAGFTYGIFVTLVLCAASIAARTALTAQRQLTGDLEAAQNDLKWDIVRVHQMQWHQQRLSARALHGPVQSAIIRETIELNRDPGHGSAGHVRSTLTAALGTAFEDADRTPDLRSALSSLARSWAPLCCVTYDVAGECDVINADTTARSCLIELLSEAVANAVRHGQARHVSILVDQDAPAVLSVNVRDDGFTSRGGPGSGLGSQILDDCCLRWERSSDGAGTALRFRLPVQPATSDPSGECREGPVHRTFW